jgi:hypothetical protein
VVAFPSQGTNAMQNRAKNLIFQSPRLDSALLWEILCEPSLLLGQLHGYTPPLNGQIQGICLEKSQPRERTFAGQLRPFKRTFGQANALTKRTFTLIPWGFPAIPHSQRTIAQKRGADPEASRILGRVLEVMRQPSAINLRSASA